MGAGTVAWIAFGLTPDRAFLSRLITSKLSADHCGGSVPALHFHRMSPSQDGTSMSMYMCLHALHQQQHPASQTLRLFLQYLRPAVMWKAQ